MMVAWLHFVVPEIVDSLFIVYFFFKFIQTILSKVKRFKLKKKNNELFTLNNKFCFR